jgi:cysteine synthase
MTAYGAEVILAPSMEASRDMLVQMEREGLGHCLDQYNNEDNTASHYIGTGEAPRRRRNGMPPTWCRRISGPVARMWGRKTDMRTRAKNCCAG